MIQFGASMLIASVPMSEGRTTWCVVLAILLAMLSSSQHVAARDLSALNWNTKLSRSAAVASDIRISGNSARTSIKVIVDRKIKAGVFTLPNPYRLIVDVSDLSFALPDGAGLRGAGLVKTYRYGMLSPGRSRMVFDLRAPVTVKSSASRAAAGKPAHLEIDLVKVPEAAFQPRRAAATQVVLRPGRYADVDKAQQGRRKKPLIVIDPGHGGVDPGAISNGVHEKQITLAVALKFRNRLAKAGDFRIITTRVSDVFVSLDQRAAIAEDVGADLFISIHADSIANLEAAQTIRGATVYMLSDEASDETARALAEKENASDLLGGVETRLATTQDTVRSILVDLIRRETVNRAAAFRERLIGDLSRKIRLSASPRRAAAFRVLRQIATPAVLVELGYMSNPADQKLMQTAEWQAKVASAMARAVRGHFGKQRSR